MRMPHGQSRYACRPTAQHLCDWWQQTTSALWRRSKRRAQANWSWSRCRQTVLYFEGGLTAVLCSGPQEYVLLSRVLQSSSIMK